MEFVIRVEEVDFEVVVKGDVRETAQRISTLFPEKIVHLMGDGPRCRMELINGTIIRDFYDFWHWNVALNDPKYQELAQEWTYLITA